MRQLFPGCDMSDDPHALKLYIDGNCYKNPGGAGAIACVAQFPVAWNREDEVIFDEGFHETTNNRMELQACIRAHEYVVDKGAALGVQRVLIVTDSLYVFDNFRRAPMWRANKWMNLAGRPLENSDLWKRFLAVRQNVKVRTEIIWKKGKKSPTLKMVDRAAKAAGKSPQSFDRGFRGGKVARSKVAGSASCIYAPCGRDEIIRIPVSPEFFTSTATRVSYWRRFEKWHRARCGLKGPSFALLHRGSGNRLQSLAPRCPSLRDSRKSFPAFSTDSPIRRSHGI